MKRHSMRLGLSLVVALGWSYSPIQAQRTAPTPDAPIIVDAPVTVEEAPARRGIRLGSWPWFQNNRGAKQEKLNQHGYCCDSHIDAYGCQNWRAQWLFMFGSCRQFFGEGCEPAPLLLQGHGGQRGCSDCPR